MTRTSLEQLWTRLRPRHGIALRVIEVLPEDKIHTHPIPHMRTPVELVVHLYASVIREMVECVARGEYVQPDETAIAARMRSKADLLAFARESYAAASRGVESISDAELRGTLKTPWGASPPGSHMIEAIPDEFFHHRGQLYAYARALGAEPPDMWDFANNAVELRPEPAGV